MRREGVKRATLRNISRGRVDGDAASVASTPSTRHLTHERRRGDKAKAMAYKRDAAIKRVRVVQGVLLRRLLVLRVAREDDGHLARRLRPLQRQRHSSTFLRQLLDICEILPRLEHLN
jgi:hypothetical protein